ncbi:3'5'-cyclic nucleotide phosphodiesterase, partial [Opisthorchis viverrini]
MSSVESGSAGIGPSSFASQLTTSVTPAEDSLSQPLERLANAENRAILRRIIIKCSDVNNQTRPLAICKEWANRIAEEYFSQNMTREEYRTIRGYMVDMVLATEMAKHFDHVGRFVNNLTKRAMQRTRCHDQSSVGSMSSVESGSAGIGPSSFASQLTTSVTPAEDSLSQPLERLANAENRAILRRIIIKCSDVNNQTRPLAICKEWANRIAEEYFSQTEEEKQLGLPIVMPNFDRTTCNIPKSQMSFIDFFLKDMFSAFD